MGIIYLTSCADPHQRQFNLSSVSGWNPFCGVNITTQYVPGEDMPGTAIVRIYNGEGFVVAADGLRRDGTGKEIEFNQQKVFSFQREGITFGYAATGMTYFMDRGFGAFDSSLEVSKILDTLAEKNYTIRDRGTFKKFPKNCGNSLSRLGPKEK